MTDDKKTRQLVVRVSQEMYEALQRDAEAYGRTVAQSARFAIGRHLGIGELPQGYERDRLAETVKPGDIPMDRLRPPVNPGPIIPGKQGMHSRRTK